MSFKTYFSGNNDAYILFNGSTYQTVKGEINNDLLQQHLEGKISLGRSPLDENNNCRWGAIDDDSHKSDKSKPVQEYDYNKLLKKINLLHLPLIVYKSKSGGAHMKLLLDKPYPAIKVRKFLKKMAYQLCDGTPEIFPKQDEVKSGETPSAINLPYNGKSRPCIDTEGNELSVVEAMNYEANNWRKLEELTPYYLLSNKEFPDGRNNKLFSAANYLKKNFPDSDWQNDIRELNKTYADALPEQELENTVIKSVERKLYAEDAEQEEVPKLKCYTLREYMNLDIKPSRFILKGLLKENSINYVSGPKGNGKTEWVLGKTHAIARGLPFLNYTCSEPTPILYIDGEMDPYDLIERSHAYIAKYNFPKDDNYFRIINYAQQFKETIPDIKGEIGQNLILEWLEEQKLQTGKNPILVLDNLRSLSNYKENDSDEYRLINSWLLRLRGKKFTIIVVDHHGKIAGGGPRGTSSKTDNANVSILINSIREKGNPNMVMKVSFDKARGLRPDETEDYEAVYNFAGNWSKKDARVKVNNDEICQQIKDCYESFAKENKAYRKSLDRDLAKGTITSDAYKTIIKNHKWNLTQQQMAVLLKISVGKLNPFFKEGIYDDWLKENS